MFQLPMDIYPEGCELVLMPIVPAWTLEERSIGNTKFVDAELTDDQMKLITTEKLTNSLSVAPNHQFVDGSRAVACSTKNVWISSFFTSAKYPPNSSQYSTDSSQVFGSMSIAKKKHPCGEVIQPSGQLYFKLEIHISK